MKNLIFKFSIAVVIAAFFSISVSAQKVFVTKTGTKYHTKNCQHAKGGEAMNYRDALAKKFTPCDVCKASAAVYVTASGKAYHKDDCPHAKEGESFSVADAKSKGNKPCAKCSPDGEKKAEVEEEKDDTKKSGKSKPKKGRGKGEE